MHLECTSHECVKSVLECYLKRKLSSNSHLYQSRITITIYSNNNNHHHHNHHDKYGEQCSIAPYNLKEYKYLRKTRLVLNERHWCTKYLQSHIIFWSRRGFVIHSLQANIEIVINGLIGCLRQRWQKYTNGKDVAPHLWTENLCSIR